MPLVAVDASSANKPVKTGVEWYAYRLIEAMKTHPLREGERVVLWSPTPLTGELAALPDGWESKVLAWPPGRGWMAARVSWECLAARPDLLFVPSQGLPLLCPRRTVTTVHDVGALFAGDLYAPEAARRLRRVTADQARRADLLLTPSSFTRDEVIATYGTEPSRVVSTPLAPAVTSYPSPGSGEGMGEVRAMPFFLSVGRVERKKGTADLVHAFTAFKAARPADDPFELLLVGPPGYGHEDADAAIASSPARGQVRRLGYADSAEVARLLASATAFAFPSRYEGFGMPLLEAMRSGTPVIASDIPPHREVAGEAALLVPSGDVGALAAALGRVADDGALRARLVEAGQARAAAFSWEETARLTWEALRRVLY